MREWGFDVGSWGVWGLMITLGGYLGSAAFPTALYSLGGLLNNIRACRLQGLKVVPPDVGVISWYKPFSTGKE